MRGGSLGHHQSFEKEERFGTFQSKMFGELIHAVGAMAAEFAFYGENSNGVGGDLQSTTWTAATMVGAAGMSPLPLDLHGKTFADETEEQSRASACMQALRGHRRAPAQPHERRRRDDGRPDGRRPAAIRASARTPRSSSARRSSPPTT